MPKPTTGCAICKSFPRAITQRSQDSGRKCPACKTNCGKPALLDLFSGAGGAARGYQMAGFCVLGVDSSLQPRYAGCRFIQADAMEFSLDGFDAIHASPPCQAYSVAAANQRAAGKKYPDLVAAVRDRLLHAEPACWVIENVPGAPLAKGSLVLCGSHFDLPIVRHRIFETSFPVIHSLPCNHVPNPITVCGHGTPSRNRARRVRNGLPPNVTVQQKREAMGIDWMNREELAQAIPPAYTEFIGKQLIKVI